MAQSIEVDEITFVSPNGTKATMRLRDDGMVTFGSQGARRMIDPSQSTTSTQTVEQSDSDDS